MIGIGGEEDGLSFFQDPEIIIQLQGTMPVQYDRNLKAVNIMDMVGLVDRGENRVDILVKEAKILHVHIFLVATGASDQIGHVNIGTRDESAKIFDGHIPSAVLVVRFLEGRGIVFAILIKSHDSICKGNFSLFLL